MIANGEKTLFYGLDRAWLLYDEIQASDILPASLGGEDVTVGHSNVELNALAEQLKSIEGETRIVM